MKLLESVAGKVVAGVMALAVVIGGITWWRMPQETRDSFLRSTGHLIAWLAIVLVGPWAMVLVIGWVARKASNKVGGLLVAGMTILEGVLLAWLFDWHISTAAPLTLFLLGVLIAGAYNLLICDWLAERVE